MIPRIRVVSALMFMLTAPALALAHSSGASLEKLVPPYVVDVGYDPVQPQSGDRMVFDFNLVEAASSTSIPFDYVWVRLEHEKKTLIATGISRADFGPTSLLYALPQDLSGTLAVLVRYQKDGESLAEADFAIPVVPEPKEASDYAPFALAGLLGIALGFLFAYIFIWRKKPMV